MAPIAPTQPAPNPHAGTLAPMRCTEAVTVVAALDAALRTGILDALERWAPLTARDLAARTHLDERAVGLTLAALEVGGIVARAGDTWSASAPAEAWATVRAFADRIVGYVETGAPTAHLGAGRYVTPLRVIGEFARPLIDVALPDLAAPGTRMLELGAGTAPWGRTLLGLVPDASVVALDLPPVAAALREQLAADGVRGIECVAGDVRTAAPLGGGHTPAAFDLVVVSGLCRLLTAADNAALFRRCAGWLAPGGRIVICDALADSDDADGSLALYRLGLAARSAAESLWTTAQYAGWLDAAGFETPSVVARGRAGHAVAVARRRA